MDLIERRQRLRRILAGAMCVYPASVHDPLTANLAESMGYEVGMLGGTIASNVVLGAPDLAVITLTELADLCHRITRYNEMSLIVDADHGYGNALHAMRTVEELEAAGVAGMTLEDTLLPVPYGATRPDALIPIGEMIGKLKAAVQAKRDKSFVIIGRTTVGGPNGMPDTLERLRAYEDTGVDGLFLFGTKTLDQLDAISKATKLPLLLARPIPGVDTKMAESRRVRVALWGHHPIAAAIKAYEAVYKHYLGGGTPEGLAPILANEELVDRATRSGEYTKYRKDFLASSGPLPPPRIF